MATDKRPPTLEQIHEGIAREFRQDPAEFTAHLLGRSRPDPRVETGEGIPAIDDGFAETSRSDYLAQSREPAAPAPPPEREPRPADVIPFASRATSNYAWTPLQLVEQLADDIRTGKIDPRAVVVVMARNNPDDTFSIETWRSRLEWTEEYTYLSIAQQQVLNAKREG